MQIDMSLSEDIVQCIVHHDLGDGNLPLTFHIPVTTSCQEFVDNIALLLSCSSDILLVYYCRNSVLHAIDKVCIVLQLFWRLLLNSLLDIVIIARTIR